RRHGTTNPGGDNPLRALCWSRTTATSRARAAGTINRRASRVRRASRARIRAMIADSGLHPLEPKSAGSPLTLEGSAPATFRPDSEGGRAETIHVRFGRCSMLFAITSIDLKALGMEGLGVTSLAVLGALAMLSIWSLGVSAERLIALHRARRQSLEFARTLATSREADWMRDALEAAARFPHSHLARVVAAGLSTFQRKKSKGLLTNSEVLESAERALERSTLLTSADLRRGIGSLATIATTAPFIGLFGTVVGIMHAFQSIGKAGG